MDYKYDFETKGSIVDDPAGKLAEILQPETPVSEFLLGFIARVKKLVGQELYGYQWGQEIFECYKKSRRVLNIATSEDVSTYLRFHGIIGKCFAELFPTWSIREDAWAKWQELLLLDFVERENVWLRQSEKFPIRRRPEIFELELKRHPKEEVLYEHKDFDSLRNPYLENIYVMRHPSAVDFTTFGKAAPLFDLDESIRLIREIYDYKPENIEKEFPREGDKEQQ